MKRKTKAFTALTAILGIIWGAAFYASHYGVTTVPVAVTEERKTTDHERKVSRDSRWQRMTDASLPREERMRIAFGIGPDTGERETEALFALLGHKAPQNDSNNWWLIANEIMERLRKNGIGAEVYSERLCAVIADPAADEVIRDYALQHLLQWLSPPLDLEVPGERDERKRSESLKQVIAVITHPSMHQSGAAGTGLLALVDASGRLDKDVVDGIWNELDPFLAGLIGGKITADTSLRASAIQSAARMKRSGHLPEIRKLAATDGIEPSVRLSSIHALGQFADAADAADREFLTRLSSNQSPFQYAARSALKQSEQPLSQP